MCNFICEISTHMYYCSMQTLSIINYYQLLYCQIVLHPFKLVYIFFLDDMLVNYLLLIII